MINIINKLFLDNKYIILVYLIFILCFLSLWNFDNINTKYIEYFDNPECPKKYSDTLLKIAKSDGKVNRNIHDIDTDYELNSIDIKKIDLVLHYIEANIPGRVIMISQSKRNLRNNNKV